MHKNARQLLDEVLELVKEMEVYSAQEKAFFASLSRLDAAYDSGKLGYLQYEEKLKGELHGRSREDWVAYYKAYLLALSKKIEFIVSQVVALVHDDDSARRLAIVSQPVPITIKKAAAVASKPEAPAAAQFPRPAHVDVFNIDNEIARLKELFAQKGSKPLPLPLSQAARMPAAEISVPKLEDIAREIEQSEQNATGARLSLQKKEPLPLRQGGKSGFHLAALLRGIVSSSARLVRSAVFSSVGAAKLIRRIVASRGQANKEIKAGPAANPAAIASSHRKQSVFSAVKGLFSQQSKQKGIFVEEIIAREKKAKISEKIPALEQREPAGLAFGWFSAKGLLRELTEKFRSRQQPILAEKTAIPMHVKKLKEMRKKLYEEERLSGFDATLLAQEARRVKKILEVEKPEIYQGSSVGLIANLTVRNISLFLVDTFPEFFGFLYNGLRAANVKVLSNTYVNIMILSTLFVTGASFLILNILFFVLGYPVYQVVLRAIILSIVAGFALATIFYAYPFMKIKDRKRKIMTNMPFAINHMAAVATSGVPPVSMFELIAASNDYDEICVEVKKIVDFINIFGYDLLTAIKTVAATTPSPAFKEFLDGIVSTIETGGDLDRYLRQETDQAALTYNLERQRYNETVSTYSDIYTGLLIAAPLFFVAAMALVNLLGGTLGGIGVDVVMAFGAYAIIPLLNIGFLLFLQFTQPEV